MLITGVLQCVAVHIHIYIYISSVHAYTYIYIYIIQIGILNAHHRSLFKRLIWREIWILTIQDSVLNCDDHFGVFLFENRWYFLTLTEDANERVRAWDSKMQSDTHTHTYPHPHPHPHPNPLSQPQPHPHIYNHSLTHSPTHQVSHYRYLSLTHMHTLARALLSSPHTHTHTHTPWLIDSLTLETYQEIAHNIWLTDARDISTHWHIDSLTYWLTDILTHWHIDSLTYWLTDAQKHIKT